MESSSYAVSGELTQEAFMGDAVKSFPEVQVYYINGFTFIDNLSNPVQEIQKL